jgi:NAD(P)-dependent dehydrogenase (short-subunit alcohol dehydrogenase family)
MGQLTDKSVILTGASRGIGAAAAEAMAAEGARLLLLARSAEGITALATRLRRKGAQAEAMTCDVSVWSQVQAAVARAQEAFGRIDALVNNAGVIEPIGPIAASDPRAWAHAADINFKGVYFGIRAVLPGMRAQGSGTIVNLGSGAGTQGLPGLGAYAVAKEGMRALTKVAMLEWGRDNVRVNTICPWARSEHWDGLEEREREARLRRTPLRRIAEPEADIGGVVVFLASDAGSFVTGQTIHLDGGNMAFR